MNVVTGNEGLLIRAHAQLCRKWAPLVILQRTQSKKRGGGLLNVWNFPTKKTKKIQSKGKFIKNTLYFKSSASSRLSFSRN
jgi:hypothetical protein